MNTKLALYFFAVMSALLATYVADANLIHERSQKGPIKPALQVKTVKSRSGSQPDPRTGRLTVASSHKTDVKSLPRVHSGLPGYDVQRRDLTTKAFRRKVKTMTQQSTGSYAGTTTSPPRRKMNRIADLARVALTLIASTSTKSTSTASTSTGTTSTSTATTKTTSTSTSAATTTAGRTSVPTSTSSTSTSSTTSTPGSPTPDTPTPTLETTTTMYTYTSTGSYCEMEMTRSSSLCINCVWAIVQVILWFVKHCKTCKNKQGKVVSVTCEWRTS